MAPTLWPDFIRSDVVLYDAEALTDPDMCSQDPSYVFSEDYESEFLIQYHKAFDSLRAQGFFIGEHIWNFADFMTVQSNH